MNNIVFAAADSRMPSLLGTLPVLLVQYRNTWGTGILVGSQLVITCAHVIKSNTRATGIEYYLMFSKLENVTIFGLCWSKHP